MPRAPRKSQMDRNTNASPSAISAGFSAAFAFGSQPRFNGKAPILDPSEHEQINPHKNRDSSSKITTEASGAGEASRGTGGMEEDDQEEDDDEDAGASPEATTKFKGKKTSKAPIGNSLNAPSRKEQNRLAQRDFRQRKQQYLRALEARVELLSATHDEQVDKLRFASRALLNENNHLRSLVGTLSGFIGNENLGGAFQRAGLTREGLDEMLGSTAEQKMTEVWNDWPGAKECQALKDLRKETQIPLEGYSDTGDSYAHQSNNGRKRKKMDENNEASNKNGDKGNKKGKWKETEKEVEEEDSNANGNGEKDEDLEIDNGNGDRQNLVDSSGRFKNQLYDQLQITQVQNQQEKQYHQQLHSLPSTSTSSSSMNFNSPSFLESFNSNSHFGFPTNEITTPNPVGNGSGNSNPFNISGSDGNANGNHVSNPQLGRALSNFLNSTNSPHINSNQGNSNNNPPPFFSTSNETEALLSGIFGSAVPPNLNNGDANGNGGASGSRGNGNLFHGLPNWNHYGTLPETNDESNSINNNNKHHNNTDNNTGNQNIGNSISSSSSSVQPSKPNQPQTQTQIQTKRNSNNPSPSHTRSNSTANPKNVMSNPVGKEILKRISRFFQTMNQLYTEEGLELSWPIEHVVEILSGGTFNSNSNSNSDSNTSGDKEKGKDIASQKKKKRRKNSTSNNSNQVEKEGSEEISDSEFSFSLLPTTPKEVEAIDRFSEKIKKNPLLESDGSIAKEPVRNGEILERLGQAMSQLTYYMSRYRQNSSFVLPRILKPSEIQQTIPHDPMIDGLPIAGVRDTLIEHEDKYDSDLVHVHMLRQLTVHEGDVMSAHNWEIHSPFWYRYPYLADPVGLNICNGWRTSRGEESLTLEGIWKVHKKLYPHLAK